MRYNIESGLPVMVSDEGQGNPPEEAREAHMARLAMRRLKWWPSWNAVGMRLMFSAEHAEMRRAEQGEEHDMVKAMNEAEATPSRRFSAIGLAVISDPNELRPRSELNWLW
jgi:hypothetical protein